MRILMSRMVVVLSIAAVCSSAIAQDHRHPENKYPVLNSIGRFLGVGYTLGGYHAEANGQLQMVRNRHPASNYGSNALLYPYQSGYQPYRPANPIWQRMPQSHLQLPPDAKTAPNMLVPKPPVVAKPTDGPPPVRLKPYLGDEKPKGAAEEVKPLAPNKGKPTKSPFRFKSEVESSPSDLLLDEGDDDDLLLESDDLSSQLRGRISPIRLRPPTANRYKRARVSNQRIR